MRLLDHRTMRGAQLPEEYHVRILPSLSHARAPYFPASVVSTCGDIVPKVIFMEKSYAVNEFGSEGIEHRLLSIEEIKSVRSYEGRVDRRLVNRVNRVGETAMNSIVFVLTSREESQLSYWGEFTLPGDIDFLELPEEFKGRKLKSVRFIRPPPPANIRRIEPLNRDSIRLVFF